MKYAFKTFGITDYNGLKNYSTSNFIFGNSRKLDFVSYFLIAFFVFICRN